MIPFDFEYHRPDTIKEAADIFQNLDAAGKSPVYYGGGSELISMARVGNLSFGAVVDVKHIPECNVLDFDSENLYLGSALTLSKITESGYFPLVGKTAGRIADHTMQCKITFGGNLASSIIYREMVLPLLLTDARLRTAGLTGQKEYDIKQIFQERLLLPKGEFLLRAAVHKSFLQLPYFHVKKTKNEKIDYPLITAAGLKKDGVIRIAFSGLAAYPLRDAGVEAVLNDSALSFEQRAQKIVSALSGIILNDLSGSAEYRKYVLKNTIINVLEVMKDK
ncbi:MAG: xanthine dehydrogenase family protein subunit M [Lawsonibacter sp.]